MVIDRFISAEKPANEPDESTNEPGESTIEPEDPTNEPGFLRTNPIGQFVAGELRKCQRHWPARADGEGPLRASPRRSVACWPDCRANPNVFDDVAVSGYYSYVGGDVDQPCARTVLGCCRNANGAKRTGCGRVTGIVPCDRLGYIEREREISRSGDRRAMHVAFQTPSRTRRRAAPSRPIGQRLSAVSSVVRVRRLGGDPC